ncbi:thymidylate kinase [Yinghuangia sp. ASG 101]|uniref:thymidylate kinase n=1 Tax=Yinghuangia sp. ASG 101 TaxID=2896848 RepID=UPI001E5ABBD4|nr:thymidylate kinase [Yinghuangia sp. ASG 101]UGQ10584.1 thymidylate kinase [Yinghuangia sp. ASG 101]
MSLLTSPPYRPITPGSRPGPMLVLEGVSGIGKSTVARLLAERLHGTALHTLTEPHTGWSTSANVRLRPLPQFAFYLSGLLQVSDVVRERRAALPVIADRYRASVIACHSAVHNLDVRAVMHLMQPFDPYLETPDLSFYLHCSKPMLRERLAAKREQGTLTSDDVEVFGMPGRLSRLLANFETVADEDATAVILDTDGVTPAELVNQIMTHVEATRAQAH